MQKVKQQEQDRHATSVANITAMAAIGDSRWAKWAEMASNEKKAVPAAASNSSGVAAGANCLWNVLYEQLFTNARQC